ncbi:serpin family protein [Vulgatibacter incomptus]|uniref:Serine protease inhibitor (Serpin family) n=1 Tax=Vulgatibacter incomptus TaxID=1391653 RepID=A0A0K1PE40_9BACT|nr:serpin family protein [Vulgatibacter incomptus]AKU91803.1 Serine protease inhibitor (serpin family) [Vulgatibacter incomptus]
MNEFGLELFRAARTDENGAISPPSIAAAFSLAVPGANGTTLAELRRALRVGSDDVAYMRLGHELLQSISDRAELEAASRAFVDDDLSLKAEYERTIASAAGMSFERLPISSDPEGARVRINRWVDQTTKGKIPSLLPPGLVTTRTQLALVSALSLSGSWMHPFKLDDTRPGPFHLLTGQTIEVPMMHAQRRASYARVDGVKLLELPFRGDLSMLFVLPDEGEDDSTGSTGLGLGQLGPRSSAPTPSTPANRVAPSRPAASAKPAKTLRQVEDALTVETLERWTSRLSRSNVSIAIPRFTVDAPLDLKPPLMSMGIRRAFKEGEADFSKLSAKRLYIEHAVHRSFVHVDERGVEAGAATALLFGSRGATPMPSFHADQPFLFLIRDQKTQAILFIGRVTHPRD